MSDLIRLEHGTAPWRASKDATLVKQYRYYDVPLMGVLEQDGHEFLFSNLTRPDETLTVWWYVSVTPAEREVLEEGDPVTFNERFRTLPVVGWATVAFATEQLGIVDFEEVEPGREGLRGALDKMTARLDKLSQFAHEARPELAFC